MYRWRQHVHTNDVKNKNARLQIKIDGVLRVFIKSPVYEIMNVFLPLKFLILPCPSYYVFTSIIFFNLYNFRYIKKYNAMIKISLLVKFNEWLCVV